ncbi:MAG: sigma-70 family RNA polymerase sigma factor [Turicibacter sp.]
MENILSFVGYENDELSLVKKAIRGDANACIDSIKLHKAYLYRMAYSYVKDEQKALDVVQECTYKALLHIHSLKNPKYFKTWVTKILINEAINVCKKDSKIVYLDEDLPLVADKLAISIEEKLDLYDAIDCLRDEFKTVIILMYFNDLSLEEISRTMDLPINTVKSHLKRAKDKLAKILKEDL